MTDMDHMGLERCYSDRRAEKRYSDRRTDKDMVHLRDLIWDQPRHGLLSRRDAGFYSPFAGFIDIREDIHF